MNVPHGVLPKLANMNTISKTSKLDIVVVRTCHNEFFLLSIFSMRDLHDIDAVDDSSMYLNEIYITNFVRGQVNSEFMLGEVPKF
jgi:hypothetical protein